MNTTTSRPVALLAAALLTVLAAVAGPAADARPAARPGKITQLTVDVTKPTAAYRLAASWGAAANATSYRVAATDPTGAVLASGTVTTTTWLASVKKPAGTSVRVTVTPYNGSRKGRPASLTTTLPDLTPPTGAFRLDRSGSSVTVTQTALSDDVSPAADITRVVTWGDGSVAQAWTSGSPIGHVYAGQGLWRPTVTLTDAAGNSAVVPLDAVVVGDLTAPTGSFAAGPAAAWAAFSRVGLTQLSIHDDFSADADIARTVRWGDGTVSPWPSGSAAEHVYTAEGTYTPSVVLTDQAGNVATVASSAVTVTRDTVAPSVKLRVPRTHRTSARSWRILQGRASDVGTGVALVRVVAVQKRGAGWYGYRPGHGWVKAPTQAAAWRRARPGRVAPASTGEWLVPLKHLKPGRLVVRVSARDQVGNASGVLTRSQRLTRL